MEEVRTNSIVLGQIMLSELRKSWTKKETTWHLICVAPIFRSAPTAILHGIGICIGFSNCFPSNKNWARGGAPQGYVSTFTTTKKKLFIFIPPQGKHASLVHKPELYFDSNRFFPTTGVRSEIGRNPCKAAVPFRGRTAQIIGVTGDHS